MIAIEISKEVDYKIKKFLKKSLYFFYKSSQNTKYYKSICYSADGEYLIAGGNSKFVNLYDIKTRLLIKKF